MCTKRPSGVIFGSDCVRDDFDRASRRIRPLVRARNNIHDICYIRSYKGGGKREKTASRALALAREKRTEEVKKTPRDYASARFLETK